ncbi:MAG TPA: hypothetical protein VJT13_27480 [Xanthobacteraceae bacterium]|nr:hypothetical protein [Xanthobacteraceae bacterium]
MERIIAIAAAAAIALAATPALAKSKKHHRYHHGYYAQPYAAAPYYYPGAPFVSRNVSDPSFGNRAGINYARGTGRCVVDLGYGRYEYCGW